MVAVPVGPIGATWGDVKHPNLSPQAMQIVGKHALRSAPKHKLKVRSLSSPPTSRRVSYGQGQGSELASHTVHHELYDVASGIRGIGVKRRRLDDGTAETEIAMPSWVINTLVKRVVRAMRGKPKSGASQGSDKDVPNVPMDSQPEPQLEDARSEAATGVVGAVLSQLRRQSAAHGKELLPLKGAHQALGSEATKAMEVAREASQKAQQASKTAGRSAATAKGANTRTTALRVGMQVRIRTNLVEFKFAPNSHKFVDSLEFEFKPKFLKIFRNHLKLHCFHPGGPVGGGIILRGGHKEPKKF